jgi:hypothetical protein
VARGIRSRSRGAFFICVRVLRKPVQAKLASEPNLRQINPVVVTGFITIGSDAVARMKRSEIRGRSISFTVVPDYASLHPGYEEKRKEAERRKTLFRNHRSLAGCGTAPPSREGQHDFRRSTAALTKGSHRP